MKLFTNPDKKEWPLILARPLFDVTELNSKVKSILDEIKNRGDVALKELTNKFDGVNLSDFVVTEEDFSLAESQLDDQLKKAISFAAKNIEKFHSFQKHDIKKIETSHGVFCWQKQVAIEKVGLYIPGGSAPLFSTVLMLALPARIAGCREIIMCSPPDKNGIINPAILYAAKLSGVTRFFKLGGVQAIGAMTYGTETVPKADKIFGPGNQYVMAAKQLVSMNDVAIDMPAGPSEVAIIADDSSNASFVASDLLSQAEHGPDSQVILISKSHNFIDEVKIQIDMQVQKLPRKEIALKALSNSILIVMEDETQIIELINTYAPEHLIISTNNYAEMASKIINAGSVFLGNLTPESAGDYASGTNHTLPTNGWTKSYSGVNLDSFIKKITFQEITTDGLRELGPVIEAMAEAEHLQAHKNAVTLRLEAIGRNKYQSPRLKNKL